MGMDGPMRPLGNKRAHRPIQTHFCNREQTMYDLDVATPEEVSAVLEAIADHYRESASELAGAWQDDGAGKVWSDFATILDRAAESCRKAISKRLG
jgi:hypothetical protein